MHVRNQNKYPTFCGVFVLVASTGLGFMIGGSLLMRRSLVRRKEDVRGAHSGHADIDDLIFTS